MIVDISERISEIISIMSILRVMRDDVQSPAARWVFFLWPAECFCVTFRRDMLQLLH